MMTRKWVLQRRRGLRCNGGNLRAFPRGSPQLTPDKRGSSPFNSGWGIEGPDPFAG